MSVFLNNIFMIRCLLFSFLVICLVGCVTNKGINTPTSLVEENFVEEKKTHLPNFKPTDKFAKIEVLVNKDVITNYDIEARCRLFALLSAKENDKEFLKNLREPVKERLIQEVLNKQIAEQFGLNITEDIQDEYFENYALQFNKNLREFKSFLKNKNVLKSFEDMIVSQITNSYIFSSAIQKKLLRVTESQIDEYLEKASKDESKNQYNIFEIVFYFDETNKAQVLATAQKTYEELLKTKKGVGLQQVFEETAKQISQSSTSSAGGARGWVVEGKMEALVERELKNLSVGGITKPLITASKECKILYLSDTKKPGYVPYSESLITFVITSIPFSTATPLEEQEKIERRLAALMDCKTEKDFRGVSEDFKYKSKTVTRSIANFPIDISSLKINTCYKPFFSGNSIEVIFPLKFTYQKHNFSMTREQAKSELEHTQKLVAAEKFLKMFKNKSLIQYLK